MGFLPPVHSLLVATMTCQLLGSQTPRVASMRVARRRPKAQTSQEASRSSKREEDSNGLVLAGDHWADRQKSMGSVHDHLASQALILSALSALPGITRAEEVGETVCFSSLDFRGGHEEKRIGCKATCPCRWHERCYPLYVSQLARAVPQSIRAAHSMDVGSCGMSLTVMVTLSLLTFLAMLGLISLLRVLLIIFDKTLCDGYLKKKPRRKKMMLEQATHDVSVI